MEDVSLEEYLAAAAIDLHANFEGGGGHANKQLVLVRGGFGAVAKLATDDQTRRQARSEVAAYAVARALGWDDLVPVTVYRTVPSPSGDVEASVQILWPSFKTAAELGIDHTSVAETDSWRVAILDVLLMNSDRNASNWGQVAQTRIALIDHGHALIGGQPGLGSDFATSRLGHEIPAPMKEALERLTSSGGGQLRDIAEEGDHDRILALAGENLSTGNLTSGV